MSNQTTYQHIEWLMDEYDKYCWAAWDNLKARLPKDNDEAYMLIESVALERMTKQAYKELNHHKQKINKICGFDNCKYIPSCIRGLE